MNIEKRENHNVLFLSTHSNAIRLPAVVDVKRIKRLLQGLPPATPGRRKQVLTILNNNGIKAT